MEKQLKEIMLQYVASEDTDDRIQEFRRKLIELGTEMKIPKDIIDEITDMLDLYE